MTTDSGSKEPQGPRLRRPSLPVIVDLVFEHVRFRPPKYRYIESVYANYREALEFTVVVKGEIDMQRDVTPVLLVGDVEVSHAEALGDNCYRFLAFPHEQEYMREGAEIDLGWPGLPHPSRGSKFRFKFQ